ncbi:MAG TPA: hypothetical protein VIJ33_01485, partial [Solirubrobacteraceae bacterium]
MSPTDTAKPSVSRQVWLPAALVGVVMVGLIVWQLTIPRTYFTGSNSVGVAGAVAAVEPGQTLCVPGLNLPADTGVVKLALFAQEPIVRVAVRVRTATGTTLSDVSAPSGPGGGTNLLVRIPTRPPAPASVPATVCLTPLNGAFEIGGTAGYEFGQQLPRIGKTLITSRVSVWFLPPAGKERSLVSLAGAIFSRAALFRPGVVGAWTYPFLLFVVLPLTWLVSLLLLARAACARPLSVRGRRLGAGVMIATVAFLNAA